MTLWTLEDFLVLMFAFFICEYLAPFLSIHFGMASVRTTCSLCLALGSRWLSSYKSRGQEKWLCSQCFLEKNQSWDFLSGEGEHAGYFQSWRHFPWRKPFICTHVLILCCGIPALNLGGSLSTVPPGVYSFPPLSLYFWAYSRSLGRCHRTACFLIY